MTTNNLRELLERAEGCFCKIRCLDSVSAQMLNQGFKDLSAALALLDEREEWQRWRRPEVDGWPIPGHYVLVATALYDTPQLWEWAEDRCDEDAHVYAWMPAPPPPQPEESDDH